jgi:hypothetical protein
VLRQGDLDIYLVRSDYDPHFGMGVHCGEDKYVDEMAFIVQFFSIEKIKRLAIGYEVLGVREFEDQGLPSPRNAYEVVLRKPRERASAPGGHS